MSKDWRLSTFNGALLASYIIPSWTIAAMKIWISPIRGVYDRPNVGPAMFVSDYMNLPPLETIRFAWILALGKVTVAAFLLIFLVFIIRDSLRKKATGDEALGIALTIGSIISFASMMASAQVHEFAALRLHAAETLLLVGAAIVLIVDSPRAAARDVRHPVRDREATFSLGNPTS